MDECAGKVVTHPVVEDSRDYVNLIPLKSSLAGELLTSDPLISGIHSTFLLGGVSVTAFTGFASTS
jgi:hypothetical protein